MAKQISIGKIDRVKTKRPGVHSKNASKGQKGYKKPSRGQGKRR